MHSGRREKSGFLGVGVDVVDGLLDRGDFFRFLIRDFRLELLLESHHELDRVERIGAEIIDKRGLVLDLRFVYAELLRDYFLDALFNILHCGLLPLAEVEIQEVRIVAESPIFPEIRQIIYMPPLTWS